MEIIQQQELSNYSNLLFMYTCVILLTSCTGKQLMFQLLLTKLWNSPSFQRLSMSKPLQLIHTVFSAISLTHSDPDKFQTTSNEAYNVVRGRAGSGRVGESQYETPQVPPGPTPSSSSSQPATAAADYEPV